MALHPKSVKDLALAPVAAEIDLNLQRLRERSPAELIAALELELDRPAAPDHRDRRAAILAFALRGVDLRGWTAAMTDDGSAVRLSGGSVTLDVALGAAALRFIEG
jgi:hypothetical protein